MRKHPILQMVIVIVVLSVIGIAIALAIPWFPASASHQSDNIHTLYDVLLIVSVPIAALVVTVVLFSVWKFRMKPGEEQKDGPPIHGNTRLEVVWTALPTVLIIGLISYAYVVLRNNEEHKAGAMTVNVTERQFAFEFSYNSGGKNVVSSDLYLAKGQPVVFKLHSLDVIHSFFVPEFSVKLDAVPGITTTMRVTPNRTGNYPAECTELCGAGHALMRAPVHVVTQPAFQSWLQSQKANAPPPIGTPPPNTIGTGIPGAGSAPAAASSSGGSSGSGSAAQAPDRRAARHSRRPPRPARPCSRAPPAAARATRSRRRARPAPWGRTWARRSSLTRRRPASHSSSSSGNRSSIRTSSSRRDSRRTSCLRPSASPCPRRRSMISSISLRA